MERDEYGKMFAAEDVHWWYVSLHELILDTVRKEHGRTGLLTMFDAGCGTGRLLKLLSAYGTAQGCDASDEALAFCRKRGLTQVRKADLNTADMGTQEFDVITAIDMLYHRNIRDEAGVLTRIWSALKPGGMAILQVPAFEFLRSSHDKAVHTARRYRRAELIRLMEQSGFLIEQSTYRVGLLFVPIALYRFIGKYVTARGSNDASRSDVWLPNRTINSLFSALMRLENRLLSRFSLPCGSSIYIIARKPGGAERRSPDH